LQEEDIMSRQTDWGVSIPDHVSWTTSNDEILVYNARSEEICGLDAVAADAFVQLAAHGRLSAAIEAMRSMYAVGEETLRRDVTAIVRQMEACGLVRIEPLA
jgi:hypothetical protein